MKIQIDTEQMVIRIEEQVLLCELIKTLEKLLPRGQWKKFKLETNTTINWGNPITINPCETIPVSPWYVKTPFEPYTSCNTADYTFKSGKYNVEI